MHCNGVETNDHILQCNNCGVPRRHCRTEWTVEIMDYLSQEHTPASVKTAILAALMCWLDGTEVPPVQSIVPNATEALQQAYQSQNDIGWDNLLRGKLSHCWADIITQHLRGHPNVNKTLAAVKWASDLLLVLWHGILRIWEERNREAHGTDCKTKQSREKSHLLEEAEYLKQLGQLVCDDDVVWFATSMEELATYSVSVLKHGLGMLEQ